MSFKSKISSIVLAVFLTFKCFGQSPKMTYERAVSLYDKELIKQNNNAFKASMLFINQWRKTDFEPRTDWTKFTEFCLKQVKTIEQRDRLCTELGYNLTQYNQFREAFLYLYRSEHRLQRKSYSNRDYFYNFHHTMGYVYYTFKRYRLAKKHYRYLIKDKNTPVNIQLSSWNSYGLMFLSRNELDSAQWYFKQGLSLAKRTNRKPWVGIISGNLGESYNRNHQSKLARPLIETDYAYSCESKQWESAMLAMMSLARIDISDGKLEQARQRLDSVEALMERYFHGLVTKKNYWSTIGLLEEKRHNYEAAFNAQQHFLNYNDSINEQMELVNFHNTEFQLQFQRKQTEIKLLESREKRAEQILFFTIGIIGSVVLGLIIVIRLIVLRRRKEREVLTLQKLRVEDELKSFEVQLKLVLSNLSEKNNLIDQLQREIKKQEALSATKEASAEQLQLLDTLQSFKLLTHEDWDTFRKLFEKLHPGFFDRIEQLSDEITKADLRLVALMRLKLSNNEMARILGISNESVQRTHQRLRKKLNLEQAVDLDKLIRSL